MRPRVLPDEDNPGAFRVQFGDAAQSWVDPQRPDLLAFEYVQHIAGILEHVVMHLDPDQRLRFVHIGGAGMSVPRWVAWRRPHSAQIVLEPDAELIAEVRAKLPLPPRSGIKVRELDGREGIAQMPADYADVIILDAFDEDRVPGQLVTAEAFDEYLRVARGSQLLICNITDRAPFPWAKRVAAGVAQRWKYVAVGAEPAVHKGKRFGNLLVVGAAMRLPIPEIARHSSSLPFGYRWLVGQEVGQWVAGAEPFEDVAASSSPPPSGTKLWFS